MFLVRLRAHVPRRIRASTFNSLVGRRFNCVPIRLQLPRRLHRVRVEVRFAGLEKKVMAPLTYA